MTVQDLQSAPAAGQAERAKLRRELSRLDTIFLISAMVVVDTIGAIAIGGGQAFTWLVVLFVFFFIPSALASAELGAAIPDEGGAYVWVRMAFGRFAGIGLLAIFTLSVALTAPATGSTGSPSAT
jgi:amino acid transporter